MNLAKNKIFRNASWIIVCRIVQAVLSFIVGTITARYLGPSNYGLISYAASIVTFLVPIAQLGIRHTFVQEIVTKPEQEGKSVGTTLVMTAISSIIAMIAMISFVAIVNRNETDTLIVCSLYSVSLFFQSLELIQYWFQAKLMSKYIAVTSLISYAVVSLYRIVLLIQGKSIYWFAISQTLDFFLISVILILLYNKLGKQKMSVSFAVAKEIFSKSKYYIVSSMMVSLFSQMDRIMLTIMCGEDVNGIYSAAYTCASVSGFVFAAIIDSVRPMIFECKKSNQKDFEKNISRLYSVIIYLALAQSIVFTLGADLMVGILYGAQYEASVQVLRVVTWYTAFAYMGTIRNIWILAENKQQYMWMINLSGLIMNFVGNAILIPHFGANGAAAASVLTQLFTNFILCLIIKPIRYNAKLIVRGLNLRWIADILKKQR